jgi:hypothetical protein
MSSLVDGMKWFKDNFGPDIQTATANTPYTLDFLTAIAVQESFEIWGNIYKTLPIPQILEVCVGDTIDGPARKTFPINKNVLTSIPDGEAIFAVARAALEAVGAYNAAYHKIAISNPNKFCHGFGIFQYDIQNCIPDKDFFVSRKWLTFKTCLEKAIAELKTAQARTIYAGKTSLTSVELVGVAIAYNTGHFVPKLGIKQGFRDPSGKYYGELIAQYIELAATVV